MITVVPVKVVISNRIYFLPPVFQSFCINLTTKPLTKTLHRITSDITFLYNIVTLVTNIGYSTGNT